MEFKDGEHVELVQDVGSQRAEEKGTVKGLIRNPKSGVIEKLLVAFDGYPSDTLYIRIDPNDVKKL